MQTFISRTLRRCPSLLLSAAILVPVAVRAAENVPVDDASTFQAVTSKLDPGGSFFLYLATDAFLGELSAKIGELSPLLSDIIADAAMRDVAMQGVESMQRFVRRTGIEGVAGFGMSVVPVEADLHRIRTVLHKAPDADGHLWRYFGTAPHPMAGASLLPADTVVASFGDIDLEGIWQAIVQLADEANIQPAVLALREASEQVRQATGRSLEEQLAAFGKEIGIVFTLDAEQTFDLDLDDLQLKALPEPGLAIALKMKDHDLYRWLGEAMAEHPDLQRGEHGADAWMSIPAPVPAPFPLQPTIGKVGDYLVIASSSRLVEQMARTHADASLGIQAQPEWQHLAAGLPEEGNGFNFVSARFGQAIERAQQAMMEDVMQDAAEAGVPLPDFMAIQRFFGIRMDVASYSVSWMDEEGWQSVGHSTEDPVLDMVRTLLLVPAGMLAGVAIPAVASGREQATRISCMNQMRQISMGLLMYAMEREGELPPHLGALRLVGLEDPSHFECPEAPSGMPVTWEAIREGRTAYEYLGADLNAWSDGPETVVLRCLIHRTEARLDGSVLSP